jgi:hypothetical protein
MEYIVEFNLGDGWGTLNHAGTKRPCRFCTENEAEYYVRLTMYNMTPDMFRVIPV